MGLGSRGRCRGEALQGSPHAPVLGVAGVEDTLWLLWGAVTLLHPSTELHAQGLSGEDGGHPSGGVAELMPGRQGHPHSRGPCSSCRPASDSLGPAEELLKKPWVPTCALSEKKATQQPLCRSLLCTA